MFSDNTLHTSEEPSGEAAEQEPEAAENAEEETFVDAPLQKTETTLGETIHVKREREKFADEPAGSPTSRVKLSRENVQARVNPGPELEAVDAKVRRISCIVEDADFSLCALVCRVSVKEIKHRTCGH